MFDLVTNGFAAVLTPTALGLIFFGVVLGIIFGSIPGLNGAIAVALCMPLTYTLSPYNGLAMIMGLLLGGVSGGLISSILINIPGTPASIATTFDGHPMAMRGEAGKALGLGIVFSFIGGLLSMLALILIAPFLSSFAIRFTPVEYFAITLFSLTLMASLAGKSIVKGLMSGMLGMLIATVGFSPIDLTERFTFGLLDLRSGFNMIAVLTGIFAISEVLKGARSATQGLSSENVQKFSIKGFGFSLKELLAQWKNTLVATFIGLFIGILPGIGAGTSNLVSYTAVKNLSKHPEKFGTGIADGIVASETANNAAVPGALIPLLTLGIPGDVASALLIGGLMIHGISPGPMLFKTNAELVYVIFAALMIANLIMLMVEYLGIRVFVRALQIKKYILLPSIFLLCVVGAFTASNRIFDVLCLVAFGIFAYGLSKLDFPLAPLIIGFILGPMAETNLRRGLMANNGSFLAFFERPIADFFFIAAILSIILAIRQNRKQAKHE